VSVSKPTRATVILTVLLSLIALGIGAVTRLGLASLAKPPVLREPATRIYNVEVFQVEASEIREIIRAFGTSQADREVVLSAQVAGEVAELHPQLKVGLSVRAHQDGGTTQEEYRGDLLVRIDPKTFEAHVEQAKTLLAEDRAELERIAQEEENLKRFQTTVQADFDDSQREFKKAEVLRKQGINTDSDLRRAQMDLRQHEKMLVQSMNDLDLLPPRRELVRRRIDTHEASLKLAELELARTTIRPPFDGILSAVQVEVGQYVRVGEPLVTITDQRLVEIPLSVTLEDYAKLLPALSSRRFPPVELAENEHAPSRWKGHVVRAAPKADEHTRTAMIYVQVDNSEQEMPLLPGTFVQARIDGPVRSRVIVVPRDAVLDGKAYLAVNGLTETRSVQVNSSLYSFSIVEEGLHPGDQLILTNHDVLYAGAQVRAAQTTTLKQELQRHPNRAVRIVTAPVTERPDEPARQ